MTKRRRFWAAGMIIEAYVTFVLLHRADGEPVTVNPFHVTAVTPAHDHRHFAPGVNCLVHTSDHKVLAVKETCPQVRQRMSK